MYCRRKLWNEILISRAKGSRTKVEHPTQILTYGVKNRHIIGADAGPPIVRPNPIDTFKSIFPTPAHRPTAAPTAQNNIIHPSCYFSLTEAPKINQEE